MKFRRMILTGLIGLLLSTSSEAFDGKHQGLIFGAGGGVAGWHFHQVSVSQGGFAVFADIGYGFSDRDLLFWEPQYSLFPTYRWPSQPGLNFIADLYYAVTWEHYWLANRRFFTDLGGFISQRASGYGGMQYDYSLGFGYEFRRHLTMAIKYNGKSHSNEYARSVDMLTLRLGVLF